MEARVGKLEKDMSVIIRKFLPEIIKRLKACEALARDVQELTEINDTRITQAFSALHDEEIEHKEHEDSDSPEESSTKSGTRRKLRYEHYVEVMMLAGKGMTDSAIHRETGHPIATVRAIKKWSPERIAKEKELAEKTEQLANAAPDVASPPDEAIDVELDVTFADPYDDDAALGPWRNWTMDDAKRFEVIKGQEPGEVPLFPLIEKPVCVEYADGLRSTGKACDMSWGDMDETTKIIAWRYIRAQD